MESHACGHLDLFVKEEVEFTSREELFSLSSGDPIQVRFQELLNGFSAEEIRVAFLRDRVAGTRKLFYIEDLLFQHYIDTGQTAFMKLDYQAQVQLVTPLPSTLSEIVSGGEEFWEGWVSSKSYLLIS